jgi:NDP-sugar pyrophosphorylase family protein
VPEIDEIILSLNYQPRRIEEVFGDGSDLGIHLRYVVEPTPLGTGGAIKFAAGEARGEPIVVFNGDVFTSVDLPAVLALHRERNARATIVLTPVDNPTAYGLVETDEQGNVERFVEKPKPEEIRCDTINAGIYVLEPDTLDRIPKNTVYSIERAYFPSLVAERETFLAYVYRGYWIDIGAPDKYRQAHRDIMDGRFVAPPFEAAAGTALVSPEAKVEPGAIIEGPCFIDAGAVVKSGARIGPYSVVGGTVTSVRTRTSTAPSCGRTPGWTARRGWAPPSQAATRTSAETSRLPTGQCSATSPSSRITPGPRAQGTAHEDLSRHFQGI